jgi:hypothetical protein
MHKLLGIRGIAANVKDTHPPDQFPRWSAEKPPPSSRKVEETAASLCLRPCDQHLATYGNYQTIKPTGLQPEETNMTTTYQSSSTPPLVDEVELPEPRELRAMRVTPQEFLDARAAGATTRQIADAAYRGTCIKAYTDLISTGAPHKHFRHVRAAGIELHSYTTARRQGLAHRDLLAAWAHNPHPGTLEVYSYLRAAGISHTHAAKTLRAHVDTDSYLEARTGGSDHRTAILAAQADEDPSLDTAPTASV